MFRRPSVAGLAIGKAVVIEISVPPGRCVMTVAALACVVTRGTGMAGLAVDKGVVVKARAFPGGKLMALTALP